MTLTVAQYLHSYSYINTFMLSSALKALVFDMPQVYDRDLTTDDFMGSASVTLSDLELDKSVPLSESIQISM